MGLVALGVCGGIGAYKAVEIVRGLQEEGHTVVAILTRAARSLPSKRSQGVVSLQTSLRLAPMLTSSTFRWRLTSMLF